MRFWRVYFLQNFINQTITMNQRIQINNEIELTEVRETDKAALVQHLNDKTIFVSGKGNMKTVWVPRSDSSSVVSASGEQPQTSTPTNVIRTQGSTHEPAPVPR